jgi:hypothetical protein
MSNSPNLAVVAEEDEHTGAVSLFDVLSETSDEGANTALEVVRIGADAAFVSFFTDDVVPVSAHYLEGTDSWAGTYARCLGDGCPACRAGLTKTDYLLLPVVDRLEGAVKVLRITRQKGPGKLLTELGQVLSLPDRDGLVVRIVRNRNFIHSLSVESESQLDPDLVEAVRAFTERADSGVLDVASVMPSFTAEELATHERISKRLKLVGAS